MAFSKKMLPVTLAFLLMSSTSYGAYGDAGIELEDNEVCHTAKYVTEKSIAKLEREYEEFKKSQIEKCKNEREIKSFNHKIKPMDNRVAYAIENLKKWNDAANRCVEGDDCQRYSGDLRQRHRMAEMDDNGPCPLKEIDTVSFNMGTLYPKYKHADKMPDIEIVMEAFEAAEKEKQLAEEKRAREKEARKIARERQQAEKDFLAAQKNLEEQKIQDAKNEKLRAEAEELNRLRAQAQAEKAELEKLEAARAELAALKEQLEAAKIQVERLKHKIKPPMRLFNANGKKLNASMKVFACKNRKKRTLGRRKP